MSNTVKYKGHDINIEIDNTPCDPRECGTLGMLLLSHKRYALTNDTSLHTGDYNSWDEVREAIEKEYGKCCILPVYMYDHSGVSISTTQFSCAWDSGQIGFIFVPYTKIREDYSVKHISKKKLEEVRKVLIAEVEVYGSYINGDVYGYIIPKGDGDDESCWGFYGCDHEKSGLLAAAREDIDYLIKKTA